MQQHHHYTGLTDAQVSESHKKHGETILTRPERKPLWKLFVEKFKDSIIRKIILTTFLSLGVSFVHWEFTETIGIFCAIFLVAGVVCWFVLDANKKIDVLNQVNDNTLAKVIRNGSVCEIPKGEVVVGDIVILNTEEEVLADGDTKIIDGHGIIEVLKVSDTMVYGKVAEKFIETTSEETSLNQQLDKLAKGIGVVGSILAVLTFLTLFVKDLFWGETAYSIMQLGPIAIIIISVMVALSKVWIPIIYDALELIGIEISGNIEDGRWLDWIGFGILTFIILVGLGFSFGIYPLGEESRISLDLARRILRYFIAIEITLIVVAVPEGNDNLQNSKRRMFQHPFSFKGRIKRIEYGISSLIGLIYFFCAIWNFPIFIFPPMHKEEYIYLANLEHFAIFWLMLLIPMIWFLSAQGAKRCHDIGDSGWYQIIPLYGLHMLFSAGNGRENSYTESPK